MSKEHDHQKAFVDWWKKQNHPALMFAIPNAAKRSVGLAAKMKAEGLVSGIPDLFLAWPSGEKHGLFIEMKVNNNKPSDSQKQAISSLLAAGYEVKVCYGVKEAVQSVVDYFKQK